MAATGLTLITDALKDLGLINAGDGVSSDDAAFALSKLARLIDNLNAERDRVYAEQIVAYALTPALQPHTIGPTGTFVVSQRPVSIEGADVQLSTGARVPVRTGRDAAWWLTLSTPTLSGTPTDLRYEPIWPNGCIYLWPVPNAAVQLVLLTRIVIAALALDTVFSMPPGYQDLITLTLAEECAPAFGVEIPGVVVRNAERARARVGLNNARVPRLVTRDAGIPGGRGGYFDYQTGRNR